MKFGGVLNGLVSGGGGVLIRLVGGGGEFGGVVSDWYRTGWWRR